MLILSLDLARRTGWAFGEAGTIPRSGTWTLREPDGDMLTEGAELVLHILRLTKDARPDLVAVEDWMNPRAQPNQQTIISQLLLHGALHSWCGVSRIRAVRAPANTYRKYLFGTASAGSSEKTKRMVRDAMRAAGMVPADCTDTDRTDACAVWRWAEEVVAGVSRLTLMPT